MGANYDYTAISNNFKDAYISNFSEEKKINFF